MQRVSDDPVSADVVPGLRDRLIIAGVRQRLSPHKCSAVPVKCAAPRPCRLVSVGAVG